MVVALRNDGKTWHEIRCQLPHRSLGALKRRRRHEKLRHAIRVRPQQRFTPGEAARLQQMKQHGNSWAQIAKQFPSRTLGSLQGRYRYDLRCKDEARMSHTPYQPNDDVQLRKLRRDLHLSWSEIAKSFPGRSVESLSERYRSIAPATPQKRLPGPRVLMPSQVSEISRLRVGGMTWKAITAKLGQPNWKRVWGSYYNLVNRKEGPQRHRAFEESEDSKILALKAAGISWSKMTVHLPGRSQKSLSRRYEAFSTPYYTSRGSIPKAADANVAAGKVR